MPSARRQCAALMLLKWNNIATFVALKAEEPSSSNF